MQFSILGGRQLPALCQYDAAFDGEQCAPDVGNLIVGGGLVEMVSVDQEGPPDELDG